MHSVFIAMPFTGKTHEQIVSERQHMRGVLQKYDLLLLEQFIGIEEKSAFERHGYTPFFVVQKDYELIQQADIIFADYHSPSIGRDCEVMKAKEVWNKRIIAIVPDLKMQKHPWIRFYSDYIVTSIEQACEITTSLSAFPLSDAIDGLSRLQKDSIDDYIWQNNTQGLLQTLAPSEMLLRWQKIFKNDYTNIIASSLISLPKTIRINRLKISPTDFEKIAQKYRWHITQTLLDPYVYRLDSKPSNLFTTPEYQAGAYYIQDIASMLPALALDPKPGEMILDLAAAPGSKTTQIAEIIGDKGKIHAVDISPERLDILKRAVSRHGFHSIQAFLDDGISFASTRPNVYDRVLVDGPCSCEGIIRYKPHKILEWSLPGMYKNQLIQKDLLLAGYSSLKPGGTLVYSTCTYAPEENEEAVQALLTKHPEAIIEKCSFPGIKSRVGLTEWGHKTYDPQLVNTVRIYPQDNNSIGFYLAKIQKPNQTSQSRNILQTNIRAGKHTFAYSGLNFVVLPNVFSPRYFNGWKFFTNRLLKENWQEKNLLEVGSGCGVTGLAICKLTNIHSVTLTDISPDAVKNSTENAHRLGVDKRVQIFESDVFESLPKGSRFDAMYWNHPWILASQDYQYKHELERGLFDPDYTYLEKYLMNARDYLKPNGRIFLGFGDFGNHEKLNLLCNKYHFNLVTLIKEENQEGNTVQFILYELKGKQF